MTKHVKHGGSVAARTIQCPAWLRLSDEAPPRVNGGSNPAADEGSMLHACMEAIYESENETHETIELLLDEGAHYNDSVLTRELIDTKLNPAVEAVERLMDEYDIDDWLIEPYVTISEEMGGSIDKLMRSADTKTVVVLDYKFGYVGVEVENNSQLNFYGLAASHDETTAAWMDGAENIIMAVIQPNNDGDDLQTWRTTMEGIDTFEGVYMKAVALTEEPDSLPVSGKYCKYCPAHATCPVKTGAALQATRVNEITADKLAEYLPLAAEVVEWAKEVNKVAHEQMEMGVQVKGYKLVDKRATRVWNDTPAVEDKIRKARSIKLEEGFDLKLKSPAQLEKLLKSKKLDFKKLYGQYVSSVSTGTTLALESDKRPAAVPVNGLAQLNAMNE